RPFSGSGHQTSEHIATAHLPDQLAILDYRQAPYESSFEEVRHCVDVVIRTDGDTLGRHFVAHHAIAGSVVSFVGGSSQGSHAVEFRDHAYQLSAVDHWPPGDTLGE